MTEEELLEFPPSLLIKWRTFFDRQENVLYRRFEGKPIWLPEGIPTMDFVRQELERNRAAIDEAIADFIRSFTWPATLTRMQAFLIRHRMHLGFEVMNYLSYGSLWSDAGVVQMMPRLDEKEALLKFLTLDCWRLFPELERTSLKLAANGLDDRRPSRSGSGNPDFEIC